ncbi:MAG: HEAT repeat domain-containing protein [Candidatus Electrothrix sp. AR4]|nr:HEAT repeat domain-containing protein [Candidatus Electrothrix sp. AR4]
MGIMGTRAIKQNVLELLNRDNLSDIQDKLDKLQEKEVVNALFSAICRAEERIRWHAVSAMGVAVARLADKDIEEGRIIFRRMLWSLNDESGGIGWGVPEAMAEIMCLHKRLADEYTHMLISYMRPDGSENWQDGNFLEHESLQRGLMWAAGRMAQCHRLLLLEKGMDCDLPPYLDSPDDAVCGLAVRATGLLGRTVRLDRVRELSTASDRMLRLYENGTFSTVSVAALADQALERVEG